MNNNTLNNSKPLKVWSRFQPTSTDPMSYDLAVHHITMRSVVASLVTVYKAGEISPQIAKMWSKNSDDTEWVLEIDDNWNFENGEKVTTEIVKKSLQRVLLLKNKQNSKSGLLEFLLGANELKTIEDNIPGLVTTKNTIKFKLTKPMPDFLEKISFGIYGIVHTDNYNLITGQWLNPKKIIASGAYRIAEWSEDSFILSLRNNFKSKELTNKSIKEVVFNFSKDVDQIYNNDLIIKEKLNPTIDLEKWSFASTIRDNNIAYVQVMKWKDDKSKLSNLEVRKKLRNIFYQSLEKEGFKVTTSFLPSSIKGVSNFEYENNDTFNYSGKEFTSQPYFTTSSGKELGDIFKKGFERFGKEINAISKIANYPANEVDEEKVFDIQFLTTGISIDYPIDDIKFMFLSKHGIRLPDDSGLIKEKLASDEIDIQAINKLLWDQAIIWPIRHYSAGFWIKNDSNIDTSELNLTVHPIDFQFLKWR